MQVRTNKIAKTDYKGSNWINGSVLMRRPSIFKKTDVTRATRAVRAAGLEIARVEVAKDGSIIVVPRNRETVQEIETFEDLRHLL
jgi:hypothetical protein